MTFQPGSEPSLHEPVGFEGVKAPEIPVGKCWTPFGLMDSSVIKGKNDYETLALQALDNGE